MGLLCATWHTRHRSFSLCSSGSSPFCSWFNSHLVPKIPCGLVAFFKRWLVRLGFLKRNFPDQRPKNNSTLCARVTFNASPQIISAVGCTWWDGSSIFYTQPATENYDEKVAPVSFVALLLCCCMQAAFLGCFTLRLLHDIVPVSNWMQVSLASLT